MAVAVPQEVSPTSVLPNGWEFRTVASIGDIISGKALAINEPGKQRPYLRTKNVYDGRIDIADVLTMPMTNSQFEIFKLQENDVLLNEGQSIELVGRCSIYRGEYPEPCAMQNQLLRFRSHPGFSARFAAHLFRHCQLTGVFSKIAMQTTSVAHLGLTRFARLILAIPTNEREQENIADAIDAAESYLFAIASLIAKKRAILQGAMQDLLTRKRRLPGFEKEWETISIGELFAISGGHAASRAQLSHEGVCYLHYGDIHTSKKSYVDTAADFDIIPKLPDVSGVSQTAFLSHGDVVFVDASEDEDGVSKHIVIMNEANLPFVSGLHTIVAKVKADRMDHEYLCYCFKTDEVRRQFRFYAAGTKVLSVSKSNIAKILILLPCTEEQRAIARILTDMESEIYRLETKLSKARDIKQGMMQELLTGKVRLV